MVWKYSLSVGAYEGYSRISYRRTSVCDASQQISAEVAWRESGSWQSLRFSGSGQSSNRTVTLSMATAGLLAWLASLTHVNTI